MKRIEKIIIIAAIGVFGLPILYAMGNVVTSLLLSHNPDSFFAKVLNVIPVSVILIFVYILFAYLFLQPNRSKKYKALNTTGNIFLGLTLVLSKIILAGIKILCSAFSAGQRNTYYDEKNHWEQ